jgi:apolipoprotein N-acyltransferase
VQLAWVKFVLDFLAGSRWPGHITAFLAGLLCTLSFSPFDYWQVSYLCVFFLLVVTQTASLKAGTLRYYLFGVGLYASGVSWFFVSIHVHGGASIVLSIFLVSLFALAVAFLWALQGYVYLRFLRVLPIGLLLAFPAVWVIREWTMSWLFSGFPWLLIGYAQIDTFLVGFAPLLGVYGISALMLVTVSVIFLLMSPASTAKVEGGSSAKAGQVGIVVVLAVWVSGYLLQGYAFTEGDREVSVSAVQGNIDQRTKWTRRMVAPILDTYTELTSTEWGRELIVWPEAAITLFRQNAFGQIDRLDQIAKKSGSSLVLGIPDRDDAGGFQNSAISLGQGGGRYVKRHLVPFGEYVPLEDQLRGLITFFDLPMSHNQPGPERQTPMTAGDLVLSLSICYEVVFGDLVRNTVVDPDVLITISNDTWFGNSIGPWQHLQMARMRAIENAKYMVRATNNGVTAVIDEKGRVLSVLPQFEPGVLRSDILVLKGVTPYVRWGSVPILGTAWLAVLCLGWVSRHYRGEH